MSRYDQKSKEYAIKYKAENYDLIRFNVKKGTKDKYKQIAQNEGVSLNQFIVNCINEHLEKNQIDINNM